MPNAEDEAERASDTLPDKAHVEALARGYELSTRYQDQMTTALALYHLPHAIENTILGSIGGALLVTVGDIESVPTWRFRIPD